ncbi:NusB antitermination factor [Segniliparus rotundus DSM 44985]|uniref:Transcription antitermination protein NusB n=1 Tax=Segniliparus rotundus (strain ATCC BAA-972 / CDC 1076 / CIP 108378 / DSM 44985 / JCM 13578) TaxID=640132 RepID=D6ZAN3_SEGRD|nr:NusB antitermination factor [Segniliparus rotundus DSM 44985]
MPKALSDLSKRAGSRRKARRRAVELLFEAEARDLDPAELAAERSAELVKDLSAPQLTPYALLLLEGVRDNLDVVDQTIIDHLRGGWTLQRLPAVDRSILRIAVWELLFATEVPTAVAVDEALELAKELSTDDSPSFINGVLGQLVALADQARSSVEP